MNSPTIGILVQKKYSFEPYLLIVLNRTQLSNLLKKKSILSKIVKRYSKMYMKFRIALISVTSLILGACTEQQTSEVIVDNSIGAGASDSKAIHVCLDKVIETPTNSSKNGKALVISKLWENGQTIKVKFLSGSASIQDRVWEQAVKWEEYANIKFELVTSGEADIRINICLLYTSPSPRDRQKSRMPSSA